MIRYLSRKRAIRRNHRRVARAERGARRGLRSEPTLILRGMLAKVREQLHGSDSLERRDTLLTTREWVEEELRRRGALPPLGVCAFCLGVLRHGRCVNEMCQTTLRLRRTR